MRAQPPGRSDDDEVALPRLARAQRCPYLEQILRDRTALGLLTRYKADCHVDRRTHRFVGRRPAPPCISDPNTCALYRERWAAENRTIDRYRD